MASFGGARSRTALFGLRREAGRFDAGKCRRLVIVGRVAGDADSANKFTVGRANEHAARHRHHVAAENAVHRLHEIGLLFGAVHQCACAHAKPDGGVGLAMCDLWPKLGAPILGQRGNNRAAGVEHDDAEGFSPSSRPFTRLASAICLACESVMVMDILLIMHQR